MHGFVRHVIIIHMGTVSVMIRETSGKPTLYPVIFDYHPTVRQALQEFVRMWPSKAFAQKHAVCSAACSILITVCQNALRFSLTN